jgi:hypothetical protein
MSYIVVAFIAYVVGGYTYPAIAAYIKSKLGF